MGTITASLHEGAEAFTWSRVQDPADPIVGSWYAYFEEGIVVVTFLDDGTYLVADDTTSDSTGFPGMELGAYTWTAATGHLDHTVLRDTNGDLGMSDVDDHLEIAGDTMVVEGSDDDFTLTRVHSSTNPLVGGWVREDAQGITAITFLLEGDYVLAEDTTGGDPNARDGMERGPFTWNGDTGAFTHATVTNTDLQGGLSHSSVSSITLAGIQGTAGIDVTSYASLRTQADVTRFGGQWFVHTGAGGLGSDVLSGIERIQFAEIGIALDIDGNAGMVAKILGAVFGPSYVGNEVYVGIGLDFADAGMSYEALTGLALQARLGAGIADAAQVVNLLYANVTGMLPSAADLAYFTGLVTGGSTTAAALGVLAAESSFNAQRIGLAGLAETGIEFV